MLRAHQQEFRAEVMNILPGSRESRLILAHVVPGGGKSLLPVIAARQLRPMILDNICWVVPRLALQEQAEASFIDDFNKKILSIPDGFEIRRSTNERDPARGTIGFSTTYQAIGQDREGNLVREFDRVRYGLVLDEFHHVADGSEWHRAIQPLIERAAFVLLMTGTLARGDKKLMPWVPYAESDRGLLVDTDRMTTIRYNRKQALDEKAIIPLGFYHIDGEAEFVDTSGETIQIESLEHAGDYTRQAIYTALRTDYAFDLLERSVSDWMDYRSQYAWSKLLVVAPDIERARSYKKWIKQRTDASVEIATSNDSASALKAINSFKRTGSGSTDILVTVAMAYEGLDVPDITHVACLTQIRSKPWIEQLVSRAVRVSRRVPYDHQQAFVYAPNDSLMNEVLSDIRDEQDEAARHPSDKTREGGNTAGEFVVPQTSKATDEEFSDLDGGTLSTAETRYWRDLGKATGVLHLPPSMLRDIVMAHEQNKQEGFQRVFASEESTAPPVTASQREKNLRKAIEDFSRKWDGRNGHDWGTMNRMIWEKFRKDRKDMREDELRSVWTWLNKHYGDDGRVA